DFLVEDQVPVPRQGGIEAGGHQVVVVFSVGPVDLPEEPAVAPEEEAAGVAERGGELRAAAHRRPRTWALSQRQEAPRTKSPPSRPATDDCKTRLPVPGSKYANMTPLLLRVRHGVACAVAAC